MPAHLFSNGTRRPARTSTGNLPEGVEFNIHNHSLACNSGQPYLSANDWYQRSNTDVPNDLFEDLGNVFAKLVFDFVWLTDLLGLHDLINTRRRGSRRMLDCVMDMVVFRMIFFELLVFFTFMLLTLHFAY